MEILAFQTKLERHDSLCVVLSLQLPWPGNIFSYHGFTAANLRISRKVYSEDIYGRTQLVGYGFVHLPTSPGFHQIECPTWQLAGLFYLFLLLLAGFVSLFA